MAGGSQVVHVDAEGNEVRQFGGTLPKTGHGSTTRATPFNNVASSTMTHDEQVAALPGTTLRGVNLHDDPVEFARQHGLTISDPSGVAAVQEAPDIVLSAIVDAFKQVGMARASGGRVRATTATGSDYRGRKAMFAIAPHLLR